MSATVGDALRRARQQGLDRLDAQLLLSHVLGRPRAWLLAHDDTPLDADAASAYDTLVLRRAGGEPFAYLVGEREFHGLTLRVTPDVLIPRPDTETLVDWALELLHDGPAIPTVLDLGTGSGAIALAVKAANRHARVTALDASAPALAVARDNATRLGLDVEFLESDWWTATGGRRWHLALSNPPYIAEGDSHLPALIHEPLKALTPGGDGLAAIDALLAGAPSHLEAGGWLLIEHGWDQGAAVRERFVAASFKNVSTHSDIEQRERCTGGQWLKP